MASSAWGNSEWSPGLRAEVCLGSGPNLPPTPSPGKQGKRSSRRLQHSRGEAVRPRPVLEVSEMPRDVQDRGYFLQLPRRATQAPHAKTWRFPPRPLGHGKVRVLELVRASKLSLEGKQPRRQGECSCWRAPRTGKESSQGYKARGHAAFPQAWRGFWAEVGSGSFFPGTCS